MYVAPTLEDDEDVDRQISADHPLGNGLWVRVGILCGVAD